MTQDRRRLRRMDVELLHDRVLERASAPLEHAGELAGAAAGDEQRGGLVPDGDDHRGRVVDCADGERLRVDEGAQQAERLEVDAREPDARVLRDLRVGLDLVARCDHEQDAPRRLTRLVRPLLEHPVVEHRLVLGDGKHLVRLEADGVVEARLVVDAGDLEGADTDAIARDADANVLLRQLVLVEERLQGVRERVRVLDLAVDDETAVDRLASELHELVPVAGLGDDRGGDLRGADLEADDLLAATASRLAGGGLGGGAVALAAERAAAVLALDGHRARRPRRARRRESARPRTGSSATGSSKRGSSNEGLVVGGLVVEGGHVRNGLVEHGLVHDRLLSDGLHEHGLVHDRLLDDRLHEHGLVARQAPLRDRLHEHGLIGDGLVERGLLEGLVDGGGSDELRLRLAPAEAELTLVERHLLVGAGIDRLFGHLGLLRGRPVMRLRLRLGRVVPHGRREHLGLCRFRAPVVRCPKAAARRDPPSRAAARAGRRCRRSASSPAARRGRDGA